MCLLSTVASVLCRARQTTSSSTRPARGKLAYPCLPRALHTNVARSQYAETRYFNETKRLYGVLEERLKGREYILDTYGIADIKTFPWVRIAPRTGVDLEPYPNIRAWIARIEARPAVQAGLKVPN